MDFAQSGAQALEKIGNADDASLILILSDINMPGMTGLELLPHAKALRPDVPVIMITAYADPETKRKALEHGADALLTKPRSTRGYSAPPDHLSLLISPFNFSEFCCNALWSLLAHHVT
jgi:CheY-like chemotaxis protein